MVRMSIIKIKNAGNDVEEMDSYTLSGGGIQINMTTEKNCLEFLWEKNLLAISLMYTWPNMFTLERHSYMSDKKINTVSF